MLVTSVIHSEIKQLVVKLRTFDIDHLLDLFIITTLLSATNH